MAFYVEQEVLTRVAIILLLALIALLAWPAAQWLRQEPPPLPPATQLSLTAPSADVDLGAGEESLDAAISPDQRDVVFVATSAGTPMLWRRKVDGSEAASLRGTEGAQQPAWKSTGNVVSFFADEKLKQISLRDGEVRVLADAPMPGGAAWQDDGSVVFASGAAGPLRLLRGGALTTATKLRTGDRRHAFPFALDRGGLLYIAEQTDGRRAVRRLANGEERDLTNTSGHAQIVGGILLSVRENALLAQRLDPETGMPTGESRPIALNVGVSPSGRAAMAASPRLLLFAESRPRLRELAWFTAQGQRTTTSGEPGDYRQVRLSPDDRFIATTMLEPLLRTLDIFILPASGGGGSERLTLALAADTDPVWAPDGIRVLFRSFLDGQPNLFTRRARDRGAPEEPLLRSTVDETPTDWSTWPSSPGQVLFTTSATDDDSDVVALDVRSGSQAPVASSGFNESDARWSPDERWLSYVSDESGQPDVYVVRWLSRDRVRVSFAGGSRPRWAHDGRSLFFLRGDQVMQAERVGNGPSFQPARPVVRAPGIRDFDTAHRSARLLLLLPVDARARPEVRAIVDWQSAVDK